MAGDLASLCSLIQLSNVLVDLYILAIPNSLQSCTHPTFPPHYICTHPHCWSGIFIYPFKFQLRHHFFQEAYLDLMLQNESLFSGTFTYSVVIQLPLSPCSLIYLITVLPFFLERTEKKKRIFIAFKIFLNCQNHFFKKSRLHCIKKRNDDNFHIDHQELH